MSLVRRQPTKVLVIRRREAEETKKSSREVSAGSIKSLFAKVNLYANFGCDKNFFFRLC